MKLAIISFTSGGGTLCETLKYALESMGHECSAYVLKRFLNPDREKAGFLVYQPPLEAWTKCSFQSAEGIIFISAAGIAVRAIAPFIVSKTKDPAVVSVDELGRFAIPLLSGHLGGANELAELTGKILGAVPVISTATDLNHQFAVDVFARKNHLMLSDMKLAKMVSSQLLEHCPVGFYSDFWLEEGIPGGFTQKEAAAYYVSVTYKASLTKELGEIGEAKQDGQVLRLIPRVVFMGIGCRKGTKKEAVERFAKEVMEEANVDERSIAALASIDLKRHEEGLVSYARELRAEFCTYSSEELALVEGDFQDSEFVKKITGVGNVCERAAVLAAAKHGGFEKILAKKHSNQGVTISLVLGTWNRKKG